MKERFLKIWVAITAFLSVMAASTLAADTTYLGNVTQQEVLKNETYTPDAVNAIDVKAGYVLNVTLEAERVTNRWAGLAANVTGTILLADSEGSKLYEWPATAKYLFAAETSTIDWENITRAYADNVSSIYSWLEDSSKDYSDEYSRTFSSTGKSISDSEILPSATYEYTTPQPSTSGFECYSALIENEGMGNYTLLWIGKVLDSFANAYDGTQANVEMLLPEKGTEGDTNPTTYYLWVELW